MCARAHGAHGAAQLAIEVALCTPGAVGPIGLQLRMRSNVVAWRVRGIAALVRRHGHFTPYLDPDMANDSQCCI